MKTRILDIEQQLIERCLQDDPKAQMKLYQKYAAAMYHVSRRIISDDLQAEDAMQEAFITAFRKLDQFKGDVVFGAWLKKIVIRKCVDLLRKEKMITEDVEDLKVIDEIEIEYDNLDVHQLKIGINQLQENYKVIINLYFFEGYDHEEIASILGISYQNSRTLLNRAKAKLKTILKDMEYGRSIG